MGWRQYRSCAGIPSEVFFPTSEDDELEREAKSICAMCGVREPCLEEALQLSPALDQGIWAGTNRSERNRIKRRIRKAIVAKEVYSN